MRQRRRHKRLMQRRPIAICPDIHPAAGLVLPRSARLFQFSEHHQVVRCSLVACASERRPCFLSEVVYQNHIKAGDSDFGQVGYSVFCSCSQSRSRRRGSTGSRNRKGAQIWSQLSCSSHIIQRGGVTLNALLHHLATVTPGSFKERQQVGDAKQFSNLLVGVDQSERAAVGSRGYI